MIFPFWHTHSCDVVRPTGPIDFLLAYTGPLALLGVADMSNEHRSEGFNSSIILWPSDSDQTRRVYSLLMSHIDVVFQFVHRFDHWLEMVLHSYPVGIIQVLSNMYLP